MNIGELLLGCSVDAFWIGVLAVGIVLLIRALAGRPAFTEKDWLALCGRSREEVFSRRTLLRFAVLWLIVLAVGLAIGQWIVPLGVLWLSGSLKGKGLPQRPLPVHSAVPGAKGGLHGNQTLPQPSQR